MFSNIDEAMEYYNERVVQEMEEEYYDEPVGEIILADAPNSDWWDMKPAELKAIIAKIQEKLKYMYQDLYHIEHGDYSDMVREEWEVNANGLKDNHPDWDEYEDSPDYWDEVQFLRDMDWKDFESNYEDEIPIINNGQDLLRKIKETSEGLEDVFNKMTECRENAMRETIESNFGWYY